MSTSVEAPRDLWQLLPLIINTAGSKSSPMGKKLSTVEVQIKRPGPTRFMVATAADHKHCILSKSSPTKKMSSIVRNSVAAAKARSNNVYYDHAITA